MYVLVNTAIKRRPLTDLIFTAKHPEVGEVVPVMVYMGRLRPIGYFCQASGIWKVRNFSIYLFIYLLQIHSTTLQANELTLP